MRNGSSCFEAEGAHLGISGGSRQEGEEAEHQEAMAPSCVVAGILTEVVSASHGQCFQGHFSLF